MTVRSAEIARATVTTSALTTIYTVQSGHSVILKDVAWSQGGVVVAQQYLFSKRGGSYIPVDFALSSATVPFQRTQPWVVLEPGDELVHFAGAANGGGWHIYVSGAILEGVA